MTGHTQPLSRPPKISPWPVSIIGFFIVFFCGLLAFIVFASQQRDDLVRPDYYEQEIRYQAQLDRINRALSMPQPAQVKYDPSGGRITIQLPESHVQSSGQVHLYRPADARLDLTLPLALDTDAVQHVDATKLRPGLWKVHVEWTMDGQEYFVEAPIIVAP